MKFTISGTVVSASALVALALLGGGCSSSPASESLFTGDLRATTADPGHRASPGSTEHEDGVRSQHHVGASKLLIDPDSGGSVRCISYAVLFTGLAGEQLARMSGQRLVSSDDRESFSLEFRGISPAVDSGSAEAFPDATPHAYRVTISPAPAASWGESGEAGVRALITRIE